MTDEELANKLAKSLCWQGWEEDDIELRKIYPDDEKKRFEILQTRAIERQGELERMLLDHNEDVP